MTEKTVDESVARPARRTKRIRPQTSIIHAHVIRSERILPKMQRVTLTSSDFEGWLTEVPDQFVSFIFPQDDRKSPAVPKDFDIRELFRPDSDQQFHSRNYTVRSYRPEAGEIDVDMIVHGSHGGGALWAIESEPGDALALWGPRVAYDPPPNMSWLLLIADDAGLPAVAAILDQLRPEVAATVVAEVDSIEDQYPLRSRANIRSHWHFRNDPPEQYASLVDSVRLMEIPKGVNYAWGGGEFRAMQAIGRYLRRERGFRPSDVATIGYW